LNSTIWFRLVLNDITECKSIEDEKTRIEAQFQRAQRLESIGILAGGIAHECNNKLTIILGFVEIAMEKIGRSDPIFTDLEEIRQAA
jgi:two-component system cell cycle sensor histidine kinase/response regulator CckA